MFLEAEAGKALALPGLLSETLRPCTEKPRLAYRRMGDHVGRSHAFQLHVLSQLPQRIVSLRKRVVI